MMMMIMMISYITPSSLLHLGGGCHKLALELEAATRKRNSADDSEVPAKQPKIDTAIKQSLRDQYEKMFRLAYNLAEGMMPFNKFKVLVKCVRENDVHLISGKDDHRAAEEFVRYIADSLRERLAIILCSADAFSFCPMDQSVFNLY